MCFGKCLFTWLHVDFVWVRVCVREKLGHMYIHMFGKNGSHMLMGSQKCKTEMNTCWRLHIRMRIQIICDFMKINFHSKCILTICLGLKRNLPMTAKSYQLCRLPSWKISWFKKPDYSPTKIKGSSVCVRKPRPGARM